MEPKDEQEALDRLARAETKLKNEKARLAKLRSSVSKGERKIRAHRLIEIGALTSKYLPADSTPEFAGEVIRKIASLNIPEKSADGSTAQRPIFEWAVRRVQPKEKKPGV